MHPQQTAFAAGVPAARTKAPFQGQSGGFDRFALPAALNKALLDMDFVQPTPIQALAIPVALAGKDILACAQTGTGKTAAFAIPTLVRLLADPQANALILTPTRELAQQVALVFQGLLAAAPQIRGAVLTGGASMMPQLRSLSRGPRVIVATPGRLIDHLERGTARLDATRILVLDEADRMLDMGFAPQLERVLKSMPTERQTLLFSATIPPEIQRICVKFMKKPERLAVAANTIPAGRIEQRARRVRSEEKDDLLLDEINARKGSILVFAGTQRRTDRVASYLESYGVKVDSIHGGRSQGQRNKALASLRDGRIRVLVATDVAARGLDVPCVEHVVNYDLPMVPEDYIHRIGRTGRAGRSGEAVSLVCPQERGRWQAIRGVLHKASNAEKASRPLIDELEADGQRGAGPKRAMTRELKRTSPQARQSRSRDERTTDATPAKRGGSLPYWAKKQAAGRPGGAGAGTRSSRPNAKPGGKAGGRPSRQSGGPSGGKAAAGGRKAFR